MVISALSFYTTMFNSEEKLPIVETVPFELELGEFDKRFGVDVLPLMSTDLLVLVFACSIDIEETSRITDGSPSDCLKATDKLVCGGLLGRLTFIQNYLNI